MKFDFFSKKKFKCDVCDEKFKTQTELAQHRKLKHGKILLYHTSRIDIITYSHMHGCSDGNEKVVG
jgi:uncharacterized protein (DUF2225 family)